MLTFLGRRVERGAVLLGRDGRTEFRELQIPVARCSACKRSARVLPAELLPRKTFGLPVIEKAARPYISPDLAGPGLRTAVKGLGEHAPCHSTLHRWLAGLGERALDRRLPKRTASKPCGSDTPPPPPTAAAMVAESSRRVDPGLPLVWARSFPIPTWKYKTEKRRDQLEACARVLCAAGVLFPDAAAPLTAWHLQLVGFFGVAAWCFPTGLSCTPVQLTPPRTPEVGSPARSRPRPGDAHHGARPPPHRRLPL
jgi:hypothetical protein